MPSSTDLLVKGTGISKSFKYKEVLHDVDIYLSKGESLSIVGESGAAKTTLAKIIAGLETMDRGELIVGDYYIKPHQLLDLGFYRHVQYLFQHPQLSFNPEFTVMDVVKEPMLIHKINAMDQALQLLNEFGLGNRLETKARSISGGEAQRLALARAMILNPDLLIADEFTSGLDAFNISIIMNYLRGLIESKKLGLILITHDILVAKNYSQRCMVMLKGFVVEQGTTQDCLSTPLHPYTQLLVNAFEHLDLPDEIAITSKKDISGCPFLPLCADPTDRCKELPPLIDVKNRKVRCWKYK